MRSTLNRSSVVAVAALAVALVVACSKKDDKKAGAQGGTGDTAQPAPGKGDMGADQLTAKTGSKVVEAGKAVDKAVNDNRPPLTKEQYEKLMLGLSSCQLKGDYIDPKCPARKEWNQARTRKNALRDVAGMSSELGKKYIKHESPAVRIQAAAFLGSIFGADESSQKLILDAARAEKEPAVIAAMLQTVGSKGGANAEIGKLLIEMADHESPVVRKKAVVWLGSSWNKDLKGSIKKLIEKVEKDPELEVREWACKYSGSRGDDKMVKIYGKYTKDPTKEPKLYRACMEGLFNSWMHYPLFQTYNEKAYKLTLKRLAHTPRTKDNPPWTLMDNFAELAKDSNKSVVEWKQKATWFKSEEVIAVLGPIVSDAQANRLARSGAIKSMVALGAGKGEFEKIKAAIKEPESFDNKSVIKALDKAIATAK